MLCVRVPTGPLACVAGPLLRLKPSLSPLRLSPASPQRKKRSTAAMSAYTVEHVVLFSVRGDVDPSKIHSMVSNLNALASLDPVLHLTSGPIHRNRSPSSRFTHLLHSRYKSKENLSAYSLHPDHLSVVRQFVLPICDDIMAVDWIGQGVDGDAVVPRPGSALRFQFLKLKEGLGDAEKGQIVEAVEGIRGVSGTIDQISVGENFSPERAKGFSVASIAIFPSLEELEGLNAKEEAVKLHKDKVRDFIESVIVLDYALPAAQPASL